MKMRKKNNANNKYFSFLIKYIFIHIFSFCRILSTSKKKLKAVAAVDTTSSKKKRTLEKIRCAELERKI
jgi:hypothetical protein